MSREPTRFAWAKLNAYGLILAGLALLGVGDLIKPGGANLARLVGEVPSGQQFWVSGFVLSGLLLAHGLVRADRLTETAGLVLLFVSIAAQTVAAVVLLGWVDFTYTRLAIIGVVGVFGAARISALWSREGLSITIPPRGRK